MKLSKKDFETITTHVIDKQYIGDTTNAEKVTSYKNQIRDIIRKMVDENKTENFLKIKLNNKYLKNKLIKYL